MLRTSWRYCHYTSDTELLQDVDRRGKYPQRRWTVESNMPRATLHSTALERIVPF